MKNSIGNDSSSGTSGQSTEIIEYTEKIDNLAVNGLLGIKNSLSYKVHEIEGHFHVAETWFGAAITPNGTIHVADRIGANVTAFQLVAGNNAFGSWVQILGSSDTPAKASGVYFDPHRLQITTANSTVTYFIQFTRGDDPGVSWAAEIGTEFPYTPVTNQIDAGPIDVKTGRAPAGSKVWARCLAYGANAKTIDFYIGIHEYVG